MDQRSTINHEMQLVISLCDQYVTLEWPLLDAPTSTHGVFLLSLSKCCFLRLCRKQFELMLAQRYFKDQRSSMNRKM